MLSSTEISEITSWCKRNGFDVELNYGKAYIVVNKMDRIYSGVRKRGESVYNPDVVVKVPCERKCTTTYADFLSMTNNPPRKNY